ncbi:MAG: chemotaxis protein CheW [Burkholderia sp.]|nr:chemotaxis protein CheW [Burkholderia sp.]
MDRAESSQEASAALSRTPQISPDRAARRARMRDFQTHLVDRMHAARSGADVHINQLAVVIGGSRFLLELTQAGEVTTVGAITRVPLTADWFLGLSNLRGNLISVVDLARFQGQDATVIEKDSRIVAFAPGLGFNCGLLVSRVLGLRNVAGMTLKNPAPATDNPPWLARHYVDQEAQDWTELDLSLITQDSRFLHVGS